MIDNSLRDQDESTELDTEEKLVLLKVMKLLNS